MSVVSGRTMVRIVERGTYVGRKKARPWTVMLSSKKMKAMDIVAGLKRPRATLVLSILSSTVVEPTFSDLTRAIAKTVE